MFLFILESIGTSELILIGIIALIFLGPRKLPEIAKKIGRVMADFRNTTNEFKSTWQREVDFEDEAHALRTGELRESEPLPVPRADSTAAASENTLAAPEIKAVQSDLFTDLPVERETENTSDQPDDDVSDKRNWL